jgi:proteasome lid subunit RPN8/RPN11
MEKMVRLGRGGSYSKRWYQGKSLVHDGDKARIDTENGFYVIAGAVISGYTDEEVDLAGAVKLNETGSMRGGQTGLTIVPTDTYPDYSSLVDAVESSDIGMKKFEVISKLKHEGISVKRDLEEDLGEEELDEILDLDPEPKVVNDELIKSLNDEYYVPEMNNYMAYKDFDPFTGSDLEVHDISAGDVVEIPVSDADAITGSINRKLKSLDDFFEVLREYPSEKLSEKSWSVETNSGEVTFQFTKDVDSVRPYPIFVGGDIPEKIATETTYPLTDIKRRDEEGALYVRPRSVKDIIEEIERFDDNESELSDSGSAVDSIYDDYYELVNMSPGDIEDRMDNMDCVHKASGDDAVEHLKRNKFIQETNKSEWDSKKVPEEFANPNAESRKVVDQAVRTVSFGKRHLGQLENESIKRLEDGCYNPRVEGLKNWAIDPLEMSGFSVDVDNFEESEMSDSSVKYESSGSFRQDSFGDSSGERISSLSDAESVFLDLDIEDDEKESFVVGYLGSDNSFLGFEEFGSGDTDSINFDNSELIEQAKSKGSSKVVVAHNHPSGNPEPSEDDLVATRDLKHDLRSEGIELVDHLILTEDGVGSMKRDSDLL